MSTHGTEEVCLQRRLVVTWLTWCHVKLLPFWRMFCVHHITMHQLQYHSFRNHIRRVYVCLAVTCHCARMTGIFYVLLRYVTRWWNGYRSKSAQEVDPGEGNSPAVPTGDRTRDLSITSPAL